MNLNTMKTWMLMAVLTILFVGVGALVGGQGGMTIALLLALVFNFSSYWFSDKIAIAMTRSKPVSEVQAPDLYASVRKLSGQAGLPMPKLYVTPSPQPNAFATGRGPKKAAVAVTDGILRLLSREELEGVLAHELAHIKNRDILVGSIAAVMAGALSYMGYMFYFFGGRDRSPIMLIGSLVAMILAPIAAMLIQMAISRSREFGADQTGSDIAGSPLGLADALLKLEAGAQRVSMDVSPASAHMFIVNPLRGKNFSSLFSTHPPVDKRVERLRAKSGLVFG